MNGSIMGGTAAVTGAAPEREPILQRMANRIFRCSHRHKSYALTPRGETERYAVCLDCGARLVPNLPALSRNTAVRRNPQAPLRLGLVALGLAGASAFWVNRHPTRIGRISSQNASLLAPAGLAQLSAGQMAGTDRAAGFPASSGKLESSAMQPADRNRQALLLARGVHPMLRLESKGSIVVLGRDVATALELSRHPAALSTLIQSGALFAVSRGTPIKICQRKDRISQVQILEGSRKGQEGWVPTWQIATP